MISLLSNNTNHLVGRSELSSTLGRGNLDVWGLSGSLVSTFTSDDVVDGMQTRYSNQDHCTERSTPLKTRLEFN